jgi:hypothetical protein
MDEFESDDYGVVKDGIVNRDTTTACTPIGSLLTIGSLYIADDQNTYEFTPQKDITAYELALLMRVFVLASGFFDNWGFIAKNELTRHFTKQGV